MTHPHPHNSSQPLRGRLMGPEEVSPRRAEPGKRYSAVRYRNSDSDPHTLHFNTRCGAEAWCMQGYKAKIYNSYGDLVWAWVHGREIEVANVDHPKTPSMSMLMSPHAGQPAEPQAAVTAH